MMKNLRLIAALAALLIATPVVAQQVQNHAVPIGKGGGVQGFNAAVPGVAGQPLVSQGAAVDPAFGTIANSGFTPGAANTVKGSLDGLAVLDIAVPNCTTASSALRWTAGTGPSCGSVIVQTGFDMPVNMGLSAAAAGNALTFNLTQASGATPTGLSPVLLPFRSATATSGVVNWATVSGALSVTIPTGATLGTSSSNVPFRLWIFASYNGGVPVLGVSTCSNATTIYPCSAWEYTLKTTVTIGAGSTSGGVLYASTGVAADSVRILGYCDFATGLATAGTWASSCTTLQLMGPGIKKPGETVQVARTATSALVTGTTQIPADNSIPQIGEGDQYLTQAIVPTATPNILVIEAQGMFATGATTPFTVALFQDAGPGAVAVVSNGNGLAAAPLPLRITRMQQAGVAVSTTFTVRAGANSAGTTSFNGSAGAGLYNGTFNSFIKVEEIMG